MQVEVGKIYDGKVTGITNFGAFVDVSESVTGLVHISEVALSYVKNINEHLSVGDEVKVKVLSVDEKGKISMSIKQALKEATITRQSKREITDFKHNHSEAYYFSKALME